MKKLLANPIVYAAVILVGAAAAVTLQNHSQPSVVAPVVTASPSAVAEIPTTEAPSPTPTQTVPAQPTAKPVAPAPQPTSKPTPPPVPSPSPAPSPQPTPTPVPSPSPSPVPTPTPVKSVSCEVNGQPAASYPSRTDVPAGQPAVISIVFQGYSGSWVWSEYNSAVSGVLTGTGTSVTATPTLGATISVQFTNVADHSGSVICVIHGV